MSLVDGEVFLVRVAAHLGNHHPVATHQERMSPTVLLRPVQYFGEMPHVQLSREAPIFGLREEDGKQLNKLFRAVNFEACATSNPRYDVVEAILFCIR